MGVSLFKPYYIRRRLCRWYVSSGEILPRVPGAQSFKITVRLQRIPWWQFWHGWYGRR